MQNNDLISRAALLAAYDAAHKGPPGGARKLMENAPAVDAAPVVHGRWIDDAWVTEDDWGVINHHAIVCSACRHDIYKGEKTDYCPHCGAKMGDKDHD